MDHCKYRTVTSGLHIDKLAFVTETESTVDLVSGRGTRRVLKRGATFCYYDSWEEARLSIVGRLNIKILRAGQAIKEAKLNIEYLKSISEEEVTL